MIILQSHPPFFFNADTKEKKLVLLKIKKPGPLLMICFEYFPLEIPETPRKLEPPLPFMRLCIKPDYLFLGGGGVDAVVKWSKHGLKKKKASPVHHHGTPSRGSF